MIFNNVLLYFLRHVDDNQERYIKRLAELVAIPSVSAWPENRQEIVSINLKTFIEMIYI